MSFLSMARMATISDGFHETHGAIRTVKINRHKTILFQNYDEEIIRIQIVFKIGFWLHLMENLRKASQT